MYIISWNINGLSSRFTELQSLVADYNPDYICLQKVMLDAAREEFGIDGYRQLFTVQDYGKWNGVMIYAKTLLNTDSHAVVTAMAERIETPELSNKGRLQVYDCGEFILVNVYVPFANSHYAGAVEYRKQWDIRFRKLVCNLGRQKPVVICGNFNIVHTSKDSCETTLEQDRPCFTRWERDNFSRLLADADVIDAYRSLHPEQQAVTFYGKYRGENVGNRVDYFLISRALLPMVVSSDILSGYGSGQTVPIVLELHKGDSDMASRSGESRQRREHPAYPCDTELISIREAVNWLTSMAATDGVVSPAELKILKEFALQYNLNSGYLCRLAYAKAKDVELPQVEPITYNEMKGKLFEEYVVSLCSDKSRYKLIAWRSDKITGDTYALENLMPDLQLRHRLDGGVVEYLIECKYRSSWGEDGIDLSGQFFRYRSAAKRLNMELFIAVGVGGTPSNPDEFLLIPGQAVRFDKLIDRRRFIKYQCPKDPDGFHNYINEHYNRRVFRTL